MKTKICKECEKKFSKRENVRPVDWINVRYCSDDCRKLSENRRKLMNYYKNRDKKIAYQKIWDKNNKDKKREHDKNRWSGRKEKNYLEHYSRKKYFTFLYEKHGGCQICTSDNKLEIHHKKYTNKLKDVMLLCQPCHKKIHRKNQE